MERLSTIRGLSHLAPTKIKGLQGRSTTISKWMI